ncbi:MAG: hypothetical protein HKN59_05340 [Gammaproteobacteria bacterium]|nr:hypothetical protein [Gammaproteobacteria bacterium]
MSPLIFINGVLLASAAAVTLGLAVTLFLVLLLGADAPVLAAETHPLMVAVGLFAVLTATSGVSFVGVVKNKPWRWPAVAVMMASLAGLTWYFLPA